MGHDKKYLLCAMVYIVAGMGLGVYMGASHDHRLFVAHAHILLVGFMVSFVYGAIHKLWLNQVGKGLAAAQFLLHQIAALVMLTGLVLMFGGFVPEATIGPVLGLSSVGVFIAAAMMLFMVFKSAKN